MGSEMCIIYSCEMGENIVCSVELHDAQWHVADSVTKSRRPTPASHWTLTLNAVVQSKSAPTSKHKVHYVTQGVRSTLETAVLPGGRHLRSS